MYSRKPLRRASDRQNAATEKTANRVRQRAGVRFYHSPHPTTSPDLGCTELHIVLPLEQITGSQVRLGR